jgi:aldehyde:ferredoxin oxidoreductase
MFGSSGKILRINLTNGKIVNEPLMENTARKFFGGRGLGVKILFEELKPFIDPLGPENKIVFAVGPVTGAPFAGNSGWAVMAKSPLTGLWGEAHAQGFFATEMKYAGYDAIIIEGKADNPVYLWIHDDAVELRDAEHLWGKVIGDVQEQIKKELDDQKIRIATIGPGGENMVRYACIIADLFCVAGRCGIGAVMGSKNLKAVALRGTGKVNIADENTFRKIAKKAAKETMDGVGEDFYKYGTDGVLDDLHGSGRLPTKNFRKCTFAGAEKITGEKMTETILAKRVSCLGCPVAHYRVVKSEHPYTVDPAYGGPEYESCASLGSLCMNDDLVTIAKANELCNKYTIDTISTGVSISFAMECYEKGLLTRKDTDGLDLTWGNKEAIIQLIERISYRQGIGDLLAEGVKIASKKIGKGSEKWALHVKGQELPMHEPRGKKGVGLSYATSIRGACHLQAPHDDSFENEDDLAEEIGLTVDIAPRHRLSVSPEKAKLVKIGQDLWSLYDSLIVCKFTPYPYGFSIKTLVEIVKSITGWDVTPGELMTVGERVINLCRLFNAREGARREDDTLPERLSIPLTEGLYKGEAISSEDLENMLDSYYEFREWNKKTGIPTKLKLEKLGLYSFLTI